MAEEKKKILIHTADGDHVVAVGEHKPKQTFGAMPVRSEEHTSELQSQR